MPAEVLAVGTTDADSADLVVTDPVTVAIKDAAGSLIHPEAMVLVMLKDDAGEYFRVDSLDAGRPALVLGPGTWMFRRVAGESCGVFSA